MKTDARQFREHLDIAATPMMKFEYYKEMRNRYNLMINPKPAGLPEKPADYYIKADSTDARDLLFSVFNKAKRSMGYG